MNFTQTVTRMISPRLAASRPGWKSAAGLGLAILLLGLPARALAVDEQTFVSAQSAVNALVAADSVLIPMQAEYFALEGISELVDTVERIRVALNPGLEIEGVVLTMLDERTNLAQQVTAELLYLVDKQLALKLPKKLSPEIPNWKITAEGRDLIAEQGQENE